MISGTAAAFARSWERASETMGAVLVSTAYPLGDNRRWGHGPSPEWYWSASRKAWRYLPRAGRRP